MKKWIFLYFVIIFAALGIDWCFLGEGRPVWEGLSFWLVGGLFLGIGWFPFASQYEFFRRAIVVPGQIEGNHKDPKGIRLTIVSFRLDGELQTARIRVFAPGTPTIGATCEVGLDPTNPQNIRIRTATWFCWIWGGIGLLALLGPALSHWFG